MKNVNRFTSCSLMLFMVLSTLGMMLTPVHKLESEISSDLLQYGTNGHVLGFTSEGMYVASENHALHIDFVGANGVQPQADLPINVDVSDKVASLSRVVYAGLWDDISVSYDAYVEGIYKVTYTVSPGADPRKIRLHYNTPLVLNKNGTLDVEFETGVLTESSPVAWQEILGKRVPVSVSFHQQGQDISFSIGEYDLDYALVIDPILTWNTFLGGSGSDSGSNIASDGNGNLYVTGSSTAAWSCSPIPCTIRQHSGGYDTFVAKLDSSGNLVWNTFLGGSGDIDIALDVDGNLYISGVSNADWGCSPTCTARSFGGGLDVFAAKLNSDGNLIWNTFLGGTGNELSSGVTVGSTGIIYVAGDGNAAWGCEFPVSCTKLAYLDGNAAFVAGLDTSGNLLWNTFLGVNASVHSASYSSGIAADIDNNIYTVGYSKSAWGSPIHPYDNFDAFVAKLDSDGVLIWNTFMGGSGNEISKDVAVDIGGNVYVVGNTLHTWGNPIRSFTSDYTDTFVAKLAANGTFYWNTFLGGYAHDSGRGIAVDDSGYIYIVGDGGDWGQPIREFAASYVENDIYTAKLNSNGYLLWNAFLGGSSWDGGHGIDIDSSGNVLVTGNSVVSWGNPINPLSGGYLKIVVAKMNIPLYAASIMRVDPSPAKTNSVDFRVLFTEPVTGVDSSDFSLTTSGDVSGASVSSVNGSGDEYVVTVNTGTGSGTLRLDITDNNSIQNGASRLLGGAGIGDGNYTGGEAYTIDKTPPQVVSILWYLIGPIDEYGLQYTVTFSEPVSGVSAEDFSFTTNGITGVSVQSVSGSESVYAVKVNRGVGVGTIRLNVIDNDSITDARGFPLGGVGAGNGDFFNGEFVWDALNPNLLMDPGFEAFTPNPYWAEASTNFGTPLCRYDTCGSASGSAGLHTGNVWGWFGGTSLDEYASLSQTIVIPSDYEKLKLQFYFRIGLAEEGSSSADVFTASIDGTTVFSANALQQSSYPVYAPVSIDVNAFADGQPHTIKFSSVTTGQVVNFNLDDVSLLNFTFNDVPVDHWVWKYIERLYSAGITGGCSSTPLQYCPETTVTRAQMAIFLLKGMHGSNYTPPVVGNSTGFADVATNYWAAAWIKQLAAEGITGGCGDGNYCPDTVVTRAQMAIFLLKAKHGSNYIPPVATGAFTDVPVGYWADKWIEELYHEGITSGCSYAAYCPDTSVTRAQMAVFLVKTFALP